MRVEVVAVGTELLLGQIADTNSQWLGEQLAANGIDSHFHQHVGDNHERIVLALRTALARARRGDRLRRARTDPGRHHARGPRRGDERAPRARRGARRGDPRDVRQRGAARCPTTTCSRPTSRAGRRVIAQTRGTAPGLICPVGHKVVYALPGVPYEMQRDVRARRPARPARARAREPARPRSSRAGCCARGARASRRWPTRVGERFDALAGDAPVTIAFLASGIEGIKVRLTARGDDADARGARCWPTRRRGCARSSPSAWATSSSAWTTRRWRTWSRAAWSSAA